MALLRLYIRVVERGSEGVYVFYDMSGATVEFGLMEKGMEKSCLGVNCVRIWASKFSLGLSLVLCLYFVNHTDDLWIRIAMGVLYMVHAVSAPDLSFPDLKKEPDGCLILALRQSFRTHDTQV